jgi:hypothetical protein
MRFIVSRKTVTVKEIHIPQAEAGSDLWISPHMELEGLVFD